METICSGSLTKDAIGGGATGHPTGGRKLKTGRNVYYKHISKFLPFSGAIVLFLIKVVSGSRNFKLEALFHIIKN
jgi:hypothetical protein